MVEGLLWLMWHVLRGRRRVVLLLLLGVAGLRERVWSSHQGRTHMRGHLLLLLLRWL